MSPWIMILYLLTIDGQPVVIEKAWFATEQLCEQAALEAAAEVSDASFIVGCHRE